YATGGFINAHVQRFCKEKGIEFTRSRPYRKNDSPYVESKNWSMVRAYTGWRRYDTEEELEILKKLERLIAVRQNIFMPQMKLTYRHREDSKVVKAYEMDIPLRRVLSLEGVQAERKDKLTRLRSSIDIVRLSEEIERLSEDLSNAYEKKLRRFRNAS
ncbi:MAG: transposase, partial [Thermodesulfovibrionales bacterium]